MFVANVFADVWFGLSGPVGRRQAIPMIPTLFFIWFAVACIWTINALRRPVPPHRRLPPLWLPGMLISELAPVYFLTRIVVAVSFFALGGTETSIGRLAMVLFVLSEAGLVLIMSRSVRGARATGVSPPPHSIVKVWETLPPGVHKKDRVPYWEPYTLDIYARSGLERAPTLIYVHPGSWMRGRPGRQARAMFHRLAARDWIVLDIRYPLSPSATFPEHLIGVKKAIAWAKTEGAALGVDPDRLAIAGGSSGAHLAALAALTAGQTRLQPGFEGVDVSVSACVPFYGIYDLLIRNATRYDWPFIAQRVMKAEAGEDPDLYSLGSPIDQVHEGAPPFLVVHGEFDSVVLPAESEHFVAALRTMQVDTTYFEVPGAQHGFDAIASLRTRAVANLCTNWLQARLGNGRGGGDVGPE